MDIRNYIESGVIESYVLGLASADEVAEVQMMAAEHSEIKTAILDFEMLFENNMNKNVIHPPAFIKTNIENVLSPEFSSAVVRNISNTQIDSVNVRNISSVKYLAAASVILLLISTGLNLYFYSAFKKSSTQYEALLSEKNTLQANNASYKSQLNQMNQSFDLIQDSNMVNISMKGVKGKENNIATVFWNSHTKDVYLMSDKMLKAPQGKQYQLWAIVDGKPVDAGMVSYDCSGFCRMNKKIDHAQAFAITLEKEGGSAAPTMQQMYVFGKAS